MTTQESANMLNGLACTCMAEATFILPVRFAEQKYRLLFGVLQGQGKNARHAKRFILTGV